MAQGLAGGRLDKDAEKEVDHRKEKCCFCLVCVTEMLL